MRDSPARILVVDDEPHIDEPHITELVSTALQYEGFDTDVALDGRSALQRVAEWDPDLVVLDVMLPDLDGFAVQRRLRAGNVEVPIVFLTARDATEDKLEGLTSGGDDYIAKPFSLEEHGARRRRRARLLARAPGAAAARRDREDGDRDRGRQPLAPRP